MKYYQLTCVISKDLGEEEKNTLLERIISFLPNPPVKTEKKPSWVSLEFYSQPEKIEELQRKIKSESQILRYLLLVKKTRKEPRKIKKFPIKKPSSLPPSTKTGVDKEKKVDIKEIDKKLEEILKE